MSSQTLSSISDSDFASISRVDLRPIAVDEISQVIDPVDHEVARQIPMQVTQSEVLIPFSIYESHVDVAISKPLSETARQILLRMDMPVRIWRSSRSEILDAIARAWKVPTPASIAVEPLDPRVAERRTAQRMVEQGIITKATLDEALAIQAKHGGRLGEILVSNNRARPIDLAETIARQNRVPVTDLLLGEVGQRGIDNLDPELFECMPVEFWRDRRIIPIERVDDSIVIATTTLESKPAFAEIERSTGLRVQPMITGTRDINAALEVMYGSQFSGDSHSGLVRTQPQNSASTTFTLRQRWAIVALVVAAIAGMFFWPLMTTIIVVAIVQTYYLGITVYKLLLASNSGLATEEIEISQADIDALKRSELPVYTVLVPIFREAAVLPILGRALSELDYPHDRLDVKLLLEEDDQETLEAAYALRLPNFINIVRVPKSHPQTKPKACNYGLHLSRGEYTVIFDAEDVPEPDQLLKSVAAFKQVDPEVVCIQAKLIYFNAHENILTRWFTAEYIMWFDMMLPSLQKKNLPIPLGGTSNHFRTSALREVGAWDPYNVTEDADLGVRLHKLGYRTTVLNSVTYEEANSRTGNWIRQRSRWVKGYMQTWLVHMRSPVKLWQSIGGRAFMSFQFIIGGTILTLLLNPILAAITTLWYFTGGEVLQTLFPSWVYVVAAFNLVIGSFAFTYTNMIAVARRNLWSLVGWTALSPVYWSLMSIAAWKAFYQLIVRPSYWEKTDHGLTSTMIHMEPEKVTVAK